MFQDTCHMRFQVPQFIEVESKIFGPLSLKQFIYLAGGAGSVFITYKFGGIFLTFLIGVPLAGFAVALAFYKVNNQPFIKIVENAFKHFAGTKLYIWKKREPEKKKELEEAKEAKGQPEIQVPKLTQSRLKDLAWSLDIKEKVKS